MDWSSLTSGLYTVLRVIGSTVEGPYNAVMIGGEGGVTGFSENAKPESLDGVQAYGAPGIVWRPRAPEQEGKDRLTAEAYSARVPEGVIPLSWRDVRWHKAFPAPKPGSLAFVGYAGGSASWEDVEQPSSNDPSAKVKNQRLTIYIPYAKDSAGVPTKAHAIVADPEGESLTLVQGDGYAIALSKDNGITMRSKTGASWMTLKDDKFEVVAASINMRGVVALGANTTAALPLAGGPATPPSPSVYVSPV